MITETFVSLIPDNDTIKKLQIYCIENHIPQTKDYSGNELQNDFDYHLTLYFCEDDNLLREETVNIRPITLDILSIEFLGENKDIPVLKLKMTDELNSYVTAGIKAGLSSKFLEFLPHVSLSYDKNVLENLQMPFFNTLTFNRLKCEKTIKEIKEDHMRTVSDIITEIFKLSKKKTKIMIDPEKKDLVDGNQNNK
jgi:hypothetical protein